jgi:hypothetical protein
MGEWGGVSISHQAMNGFDLPAKAVENTVRGEWPVHMGNPHF